MRLTSSEQEAIRSVVFKLDPQAKIYLFGSRASDEKKGGDIDLLILSDKINEQSKRDIKIQLYNLIGEQKIDLLIGSDTSDPFIRIALETGVPL